MFPPCVLMYITDDKKNIKYFVRWILYFITASFVAVGLNYNFSDDGLRHLAFAQNAVVMKSWGEVFPMSLFDNYDPWFFWDNLLSYVIKISSYDVAHIVVNIFSIFILLIMIDTLFTIEMKRYKNTIVLLSILLLTSVFARYTNLRPDLLSGFYTMGIYIIFKSFDAKRRFLVVFIASLMYLPMYYLFFVYTLAMTMYMFLMRDYKSMFSLLLATSIGFGYYYFQFGAEAFTTLKYILSDEKLRDGLYVGEGLPIFDTLAVVNVKILFLIYLIGVLYLKIKHQNFLINNSLFSLLITLSLLWVGQLRYTSLFSPFFYVLAISFILNLRVRDVKYYFYKARILLLNFFKGYAKNSRNVSFLVIFALFAAFESGLIMKSDYEDTNNEAKAMFSEFKSEKYNNSTILFNTLDKASYYALYSNPTIKEVPSCSIGWDYGTDRFHILYRKMVKKDISSLELRELAEIVDADYLILKLPVNNKKDFDVNKLNCNSFKILKFFGEYLLISRKKS